MLVAYLEETEIATRLQAANQSGQDLFPAWWRPVGA